MYTLKRGPRRNHLLSDFQLPGLGGNKHLSFELPVLPKAVRHLCRYRPKPLTPQHTARPSELPEEPPAQVGRGKCHVFPQTKIALSPRTPGLRQGRDSF